MTESCVQEIKLPHLNLISFIKEVESKHGKILTLSELYARNQKLGNDVILGVVDTVFPVNKKGDGQLQVIRLFEVTTDCHKGQLFSVYAYDKFVTSLTDACLHEGDFAAFCAACIRESSQYRIEEGCHHLEAHMGIPEHPSAKIFFSRKPHITNAGTSKQQGSSTVCESSDVSLEQHETPNTVGLSASSTETSHNAARILPVPSILSHTSPSVLPCASSSYDNQIQHVLDDSAVSLQRTQKKCTYKKLSELTEPDKRFNIYGVIHTIAKVPREDKKHAVVRLRDETCGPGETFRVHIFFRHETTYPKLEHGYILRLLKMKTELFDGVVDGRVFSATDVVTFPPYGEGIANAFYTCRYLNFGDSDAERLTELRRWIASQNQQQPLPAVPVTSNTTLPSPVPGTSNTLPSPVPVTSNTLPSPVPVTSNTTLPSPVLSSEPGRTRLCEIKEEGNYVLHCKVLDVHDWSDEVRSFTVADGTFFVNNFHLDESEWCVTQEVRIMVLDPSPLLKNIKTGALVELTNVTVQAAAAPISSICNWPYFSLKVNGNNCSVKIFSGFELEAIQLKRQLQDASLVR